MAVEYEISSDVATLKEVAPTTQLAHVVKFYNGAVTYDDEASSKFATVTIDGKSQRVMLCIAVNGTVDYDDVPCKYSTVDGHRCLNIVEPNGTETADDVPSVYETMVVDGKTVRAIRCVLINQTPIYDGVSSVCTFVDNGKTHTAQLVNVVGSGAIEVIVKGVPPLVLPDAVEDDIVSLTAFGGIRQGLPSGYDPVNFIYFLDGAYLLTDIVPTYDGKVEMDFATTTVVASAAILGGRTISYGGLFMFLGSDSKFVVDAFSATSTNRYTSSVTAQNNTRYKFTFNNKVGTLESGGTTLFTNTFAGTEANGKELIINGNNNNGSVTGNTEGMYLYSFKAWDNQGNLVANYVPCAKTNPLTVGLYDLVSDTFINAPTSGTWAAGPAAGASVDPTPDAPIDIVCNNGVLKNSANLVNITEENVSIGKYITPNGAISSNANNFYYTKMIPVKPNTQYTGSFSHGLSSFYFAEYEADGTFVARTQKPAGGASFTLTTGAATKFLLFGSNINGTAVSLEDIEDCDFMVCEGTSTVYVPYGVYADGTVETIKIDSANLFNKNDTDNIGGWYANANTIQNSTSNVTYVMRCKPNTTYYAKHCSVVGATRLFYTEVENWQVGSACSSQVGTISDQPNTVRTITTSANAKWLFVNFARTGQEATVEQQTNDFILSTQTLTSSTEYVKYNDSVATAEMLLKVDDTYQDQQEITTGAVTRKVGIRVFDGSETWTYNASLSRETYSAFWAELVSDKKENVTVLCSHFVGKQNQIYIGAVNQIGFHRDAPYAGRCYITLDKDTYQQDGDKVKQFFAEQYANGTPVIIVYPLATATTESVTAQPMHTELGDNTVSITQASLDDLELSVTYLAGVQLTVEEVEDAQLSQDVEVTIQ